MLRKNVNSISWLNHMCDNVPFYAWQCISIETNERNVDLIITDEKDMMRLIQLLVYKCQTVDGIKGSAVKFIRGFGYANTINTFR